MELFNGQRRNPHRKEQEPAGIVELQGVPRNSYHQFQGISMRKLLWVYRSLLAAVVIISVAVLVEMGHLPFWVLVLTCGAIGIGYMVDVGD